ncbi:MAG: TonB-dependent receptor plug domain-containing protein [Gammaproteobacteria bacterium]
MRLKDVLQNVSGVQFTPSSGNEFAAFVIRGFPIFDNARFCNGRRFRGAFKSDLANIEQIEVLKGPAAVLYGRLEPSGLVNLVTKKPLEEPYYALQQQFGSYDFYRTLKVRLAWAAMVIKTPATVTRRRRARSPLNSCPSPC